LVAAPDAGSVVPDAGCDREMNSRNGCNVISNSLLCVGSDRGRKGSAGAGFQPGLMCYICELDFV
jgi:hypothetical protein